MVQWLRLWATNAGGLTLIPGQGTRSHMPKLRPGAAKQIYIQLSFLKRERSQRTSVRGALQEYPSTQELRSQGSAVRRAEAARGQRGGSRDGLQPAGSHFQQGVPPRLSSCGLVKSSVFKIFLPAEKALPPGGDMESPQSVWQEAGLVDLLLH